MVKDKYHEKKRAFFIKIPQRLIDAMNVVKKERGITLTIQAERALEKWLAELPEEEAR